MLTIIKLTGLLIFLQISGHEASSRLTVPGLHGQLRAKLVEYLDLKYSVMLEDCRFTDEIFINLNE